MSDRYEFDEPAAPLAFSEIDDIIRGEMQDVFSEKHATPNRSTGNKKTNMAALLSNTIHGPGVYFLLTKSIEWNDDRHSEPTELIKIGLAGEAMDKRLREISGGLPVKSVHLCGITPRLPSMILPLEQHIHALFDEYRTRREWFIFRGRLRQFITELIVGILSGCDIAAALLAYFPVGWKDNTADYGKYSASACLSGAHYQTTREGAKYINQ